LSIKFENKNVSLFLKRGAAHIIDSLIVAITAQIIMFIFGLVFVWSDNGMANFTLLLWAEYYVFMLGKYGYTFGKKLLGLKVVLMDNSPIDYKTAFYRFLATALSTLIVFIGFIMIMFNKKGFALHDKIAGTFVQDNALVSLEEPTRTEVIN